MSMSVCNAVSRTQFTQNPCHACYGALLGRDAPSPIALAKQMELGFDALLRAPNAPPLDHIDAIPISPFADEVYDQ